ncbi:DUF58 domain-containing protein [Aliamphritea spongicola]|nr:DUF58 domain-containing protein [Aliamphritea spongicola]
MDFAEVREYQPGDDIRSMDWRVTARTGSPIAECLPKSGKASDSGGGSALADVFRFVTGF